MVAIAVERFAATPSNVNFVIIEYLRLVAAARERF
jgi:hypothetical protein